MTWGRAWVAVALSSALSVPRLAQADEAPPTASAPVFLQSTGTPVEFEATKPLISIFVAPGLIADTTPRFPDPFVKLGRTPLSSRFVPGVYTVSVESPDIPVASTVVNVGADPVHVRVKAGSDRLRGIATLLMAIGGAALLGGIVVETSYTTAPNGISKSKIAVPLFAIGGVGVASGVTFYFLSNTTFDQSGSKADGRMAGVGITSIW